MNHEHERRSFASRRAEAIRRYLFLGMLAQRARFDFQPTRAIQYRNEQRYLKHQYNL